MTVTTIAYAAHIAYLEPFTGNGLLVLPRPADDHALGGRSLHEADWGQVIRDLDRLGWEPSEDEHRGLSHVGTTRDGRDVVALYGREAITSDPTLPEMARAFKDLMSATLTRDDWVA